MSAMNSGTHGASKIATMPGPVRKLRSALMSRSPCSDCARLERALWRNMLERMRGPSSRSSFIAARASSRVRMASRYAMTSSAISVSTNSITSVSTLRLLTTRSNTCSMNSAGASISTLITRLKNAAAMKWARNWARNSRIAFGRESRQINSIRQSPAGCRGRCASGGCVEA